MSQNVLVQRLSISRNHEIFIKNPAPGLRYSGASFIISETVSILLSDIGTIFDFINPAFRHKEVPVEKKRNTFAYCPENKPWG